MMAQCLSSSVVSTSKPSLIQSQRLISQSAQIAPRITLATRRVSVKTLAVAEVSAPNAAASKSSLQPLTAPVLDVHSPQELDALKAKNADKLIVLMCKATGCKPCKKFRPNYAAAANYYSDAIFCEILGNETTDTRNLMKSMEIKVTPTFVMFRNNQIVTKHGGINEEKFHKAIQEHMKEGEAGFGSYTLMGEDDA